MRVALLLLLGACAGDAAAMPDAPRQLVAQTCGADSCTSTEACITEWTVTCEVLRMPPSSCIPCAADAGIYHCPFTACGTLPTGCTSCSCLQLVAECVCTDDGSSISVVCNQPN